MNFSAHCSCHRLKKKVLFFLIVQLDFILNDSWGKSAVAHVTHQLQSIAVREESQGCLEMIINVVHMCAVRRGAQESTSALQPHCGGSSLGAGEEEEGEEQGQRKENETVRL